MNIVNQNHNIERALFQTATRAAAADQGQGYPQESFCGTVPNSVRPAVCPAPISNTQKAINLVAHGQLTQVNYARSIPRKAYHRPEAPGPFKSISTDATFVSQGHRAEVSFGTGLGHLAPVNPGVTEVSGGVVVSYDGGERQTLNDKEVDALLGNLYGRYSNEMTRKNARDLEHMINMTMAVRYDSPEEVAAKHEELSRTRIQQPEVCPEF